MEEVFQGVAEDQFGEHENVARGRISIPAPIGEAHLVPCGTCARPKITEHTKQGLHHSIVLDFVHSCVPCCCLIFPQKPAVKVA